MLRTNLATRPFYNERIVQLAIGALGVIVLALTLFNVIQLLQLSASESRLGAHAAEAEREADRLRAEAARIRTQIDPKEVQAVAVAAREANGIIDQRTFSWTDLFAKFESTLPADVRIKAVQPRLERGVFTVAVIAQARRVDDLDDFIEALEKTGAFRNVRPAEESSRENLIEAVIEGTYVVPPRIEKDPNPAASLGAGTPAPTPGAPLGSSAPSPSAAAQDRPLDSARDKAGDSARGRP